MSFIKIGKKIRNKNLIVGPKLYPDRQSYRTEPSKKKKNSF